MAGKLTSFDQVEGLTSDETLAAFTAEAFSSEDAGYFGFVARAKSMAQIANETGVSRKQLFRSFSENGSPTLRTTLVVMRALGVE